MAPINQTRLPGKCPACEQQLNVTRLQCSFCGSEVAGVFPLHRLAALQEPHASLIEMFLRVRGNVKEMEREMGLSYPTVRGRLEEALSAAGFDRQGGAASPETMADQRSAILSELEGGTISAGEAASRLRQLKRGA